MSGAMAAAAASYAYSGWTFEQKWSRIEPYAERLAATRQRMIDFIGDPNAGIESIRAELEYDLAKRDYDEQKLALFSLR